MNGGLRTWKNKKFETTAAVPRNVREGDLVSTWEPDWIITYTDVLRNFETREYMFIDARPRQDYTGESKKSRDFYFEKQRNIWA